MSVEMLQEMARNFYVLAGVFSGVALILFFRFKIWKIVGDLSGVNAKRGIKEISKQERTIESCSQGFLNMKSLQGDSTESFVCAENTGLLEQGTEQENYYVIKKMEYIASAEWIE